MSNLYDSESILAELGINSATVKAIKRGIKRSSYRAVINWLTKYQPNTDASNLEKVKGLLEAFYHLGELEDWSRAGFILCTKIDILDNQILTNRLHAWGYHEYKIFILKKILGKLNERFDAFCLRNLASSYFLLGQKDISIEYSEMSVELARRNNDYENEKLTLRAMVNLYFSLGEYQKTADFCYRWLKIQEKSHNPQEKGEILAALAGSNYMIGKDREAEDAFKQGILCIKTVDEKIKINVLNAQGNVYFSIHKYDNALECYKEAWQTAQKIGKYPGGVLQNLGKALVKLGKYEEALNFFLIALDVSINDGILVGETACLYNLAELYQVMNQPNLALEYCIKALSIATELNIPLQKECRELKQKLERNHE